MVKDAKAELLSSQSEAGPPWSGGGTNGMKMPRMYHRWQGRRKMEMGPGAGSFPSRKHGRGANSKAKAVSMEILTRQLKTRDETLRISSQG